jgi:maltooligosyltrehalose trehalohydrolase
MSSQRDNTYSFFTNFEPSEQVTDEGPMATCSSFFCRRLRQGRPQHSTTCDSHLNKGFNFMGDSDSIPPLGATPLPGQGWLFVVWAPFANELSVHIVGHNDQVVPMQKSASGYFETTIQKLQPDARYLYRFEDGREFPDPASRFQPEGVHGPSQVIDLNDFKWTDSSWRGLDLDRSVIYELHVGTYTPEGTFEALIPHLAALRDLGITTIELMPVTQFPGSRNWGYDGVQPFAPQNSYGGPCGLQKLVDAAHADGLAVALDVVYNHLGPEGNYFNAYGPYFTDKYQTPWGKAINYDGPDSDPVRYFFIANALHWLENYHIDVLRLDAVHGIFDFGASHFLAELQQAVKALGERLGRKLHLIVESDLNDSRLLRPPAQGGYGLPSQWSDDFHHSLHSLLTGERAGYYSDFGDVHHLAVTMRNGWFYAGQHSKFRRRRHGNSPTGLARSSFVVCIQNHDQIGNRARGERLSALVNFEALKLAAGVTVLAPFIPLLFMGEEYGEIAPFQYFTSHGDQALIEAVRKGRQEEFAAFAWEGKVPDPQDETTFSNSKLDHRLKSNEPHQTLHALYRELLAIRREYALAGSGKLDIFENGTAITMVAGDGTSKMLAAIYEFGKVEHTVDDLSLPTGHWSVRINSTDKKWRGPGNSLTKEIKAADPLTLSAQSFVVLERVNSITE